MGSINIVSATRLSQQAFLERAALGRSLVGAYNAFPIRLKLFPENTRSLSECYNNAIDHTGGDDILVFVHDDVFITDFFWMDHLTIALDQFDLVGVVGNIRRQPRQPNWCFVDENQTWDDFAYLSGMIGQGHGFPCRIGVYGAAFQPCRLLDGVFLAARRKTFIDHGIRFDERFMFDFYDVDICRQFEARGLRMGTTPISLIHESEGDFTSPQWRQAYQAYLEKWSD